MTMQKVQAFLRDDQKAALRSLAARRGCRQSELIRRGVDLLLEQAEQDKEDWRAATRAVAGIWRDHDDIDDIIKENREAVKRRIAALYERR